MRRVFLFSVVVALALAMGMGAVAAQGEANATAGNETTGPTGETVDDELTITDWHFDGDAFVLELHAERSMAVTATPSQQMSEGAQQVTWVTKAIPRGNSTIRVPAETVSGEAAVVVSTRDSRRDGRAVQLATGSVGENPFSPFGGTSGVLSGVMLSIGMAGGAAAWVLRSEESGVIKA
ncbi:hypothetical protein [Halovivax limisalsi]|uniref:hypothetical protein n=1 Tax=Halovivax limisalsi TaxID=1453760 RepID=UPI001FFD5197|nr:hypothetical protein [Halovivax limisalsi]